MKLMILVRINGLQGLSLQNLGRLLERSKVGWFYITFAIKSDD